MIVDDRTTTFREDFVNQSSEDSEPVDNVGGVTDQHSRDDLRAIENVAEAIKQVQLMPVMQQRPVALNTDGSFSSVVVHGGGSQDSPRSEVKVSYARPMQLTHWSDMDVSGGNKQEWTFDSEPPVDIKKTQPKKKQQFRVRFNSPNAAEQIDQNSQSLSDPKTGVKNEQKSKTFSFLRLPENVPVRKQMQQRGSYKWKNVEPGVEVSSNLITSSEHSQIPGIHTPSRIQPELSTVKHFDHENALGNSDTFDQSNAIIKPRDQRPIVHDSEDYIVDSRREVTRTEKALNREKEESQIISTQESPESVTKQMSQTPPTLGHLAQSSDHMRPFVAEIRMPGQVNNIPALIIPMPQQLLNGALAGLQEGNTIHSNPQIAIPFGNIQIKKPFPAQEPLHSLRGQSHNFGVNIHATQASPQSSLHSAILRTQSTDMHLNGPNDAVRLLAHPFLVHQQSSPHIRPSPDPNVQIFTASQSGQDLLGQRGSLDQRNRPVINRDQLLQQSIAQWNQQYLTGHKNPLHVGPQVFQQPQTRFPAHGSPRPQQPPFFQRPPSIYPQYPGLVYPQGQVPRQSGTSPHYGLNGIMSQHFQLPVSKNPPSDGQYIFVGDKNVCAVNGQCFGAVNNADERP